MVPPDAFSTDAAQSSSAFCSGCDAGTQCEILSSMVFSCASAGVTLAATASARSVFFIRIVSLFWRLGLKRPLQILLYDIIIRASPVTARGRLSLKLILSGRASIADEGRNHR